MKQYPRHSCGNCGDFVMQRKNSGIPKPFPHRSRSSSSQTSAISTCETDSSLGSVALPTPAKQKLARVFDFKFDTTTENPDSSDVLEPSNFLIQQEVTKLQGKVSALEKQAEISNKKLEEFRVRETRHQVNLEEVHRVFSRGAQFFRECQLLQTKELERTLSQVTDDLMKLFTVSLMQPIEAFDSMHAKLPGSKTSISNANKVEKVLDLDVLQSATCMAAVKDKILRSDRKCYTEQDIEGMLLATLYDGTKTNDHDVLKDTVRRVVQNLRIPGTRSRLLVKRGDKESITDSTKTLGSDIKYYVNSKICEVARRQAGGIIVGGRFNGYISMSRAIGDDDLKSHRNITPFHFNSGKKFADDLFTGEPDIANHRIQPTDVAVVVASDGVWGSLSNIDVATVVRNEIRKERDVHGIAKAVVKKAMSRGSKDNATAVVAFLRDEATVRILVGSKYRRRQTHSTTTPRNIVDIANEFSADDSRVSGTSRSDGTPTLSTDALLEKPARL